MVYYPVETQLAQ